VKRSLEEPELPKSRKFKQERWTEEEKLKFRQGIRLFGAGNWSEISLFIGTRTNIQVRDYARGTGRSDILKATETEDLKPINELSRACRVLSEKLIY